MLSAGEIPASSYQFSPSKRSFLVLALRSVPPALGIAWLDLDRSEKKISLELSRFFPVKTMGSASIEAVVMKCKRLHRLIASNFSSKGPSLRARQASVFNSVNVSLSYLSSLFFRSEWLMRTFLAVKVRPKKRDRGGWVTGATSEVIRTCVAGKSTVFAHLNFDKHPRASPSGVNACNLVKTMLDILFSSLAL